jgi:hypothetical protein
MHKLTSLFVLSSIMAAQSVSSSLNASQNAENTSTTLAETQISFSPFTGRITRNKVRMRLNPSLDSSVIRELNKDDLLVIVSENEDFYGIQAPNDIKAFVYRTFVLDNVVEGNHVNVRLEPTTDAPVIAQLNAGERIEGTISPINSKWLEITPPKATLFYVAKDFVEKIGDPTLIQTISKRRENINRLLESTCQISELELQKPYQEIQMSGIFQNLNKIISDKNNSSEQIDKARSLLTLIQDRYLHKKIAFLEEKPQTVYITKFQNENTTQDIQTTPQSITRNPITAKMLSWLPVEESFFSSWINQNPENTPEAFEVTQKQEAVTIKGLVEAYDRSVKNKPGDYLLVNSSNHLPIAYLYSTKFNLQDVLGEEVVLEVTNRPNNNFAFPAYFVLGIQK